MDHKVTTKGNNDPFVQPPMGKSTTLMGYVWGRARYMDQPTMLRIVRHVPDMHTNPHKVWGVNDQCCATETHGWGNDRSVKHCPVSRALEVVEGKLTCCVVAACDTPRRNTVQLDAVASAMLGSTAGRRFVRVRLTGFCIASVRRSGFNACRFGNRVSTRLRSDIGLRLV